MKQNVATKVPAIRTHEGGRAARISPEKELRRTLMACLLWEDTFYENGMDVAVRIKNLVGQVDAEPLRKLAIEARGPMNLRHAPLLLCREMARNKKLDAATLEAVIQRADELAEFLAIYWKDGRRPLAAQVKKGLARAFRKFNEYSLAKYNRDGAVKLRDVLFLTHARPRDAEQAALWKRLVEGQLATPDTWEVELSKGGGEGQKAAWERLLSENKLGALALLRNLRNMEQAGVAPELIRRKLAVVDVRRVLPFRLIAAARYAPRYEADLEALLFRASDEARGSLKGETILLIDVSGSMEDRLSAKSDMTRMDAACGLAMIARELCESVRIFTFSRKTVEVAGRRGFALRDAIVNSQEHCSTYLGGALAWIRQFQVDRLIVVSDEQAHDDASAPNAKRAYMLNVGTYRNGVGYGRRWTHIDGFSEACVRYILEYEREER